MKAIIFSLSLFASNHAMACSVTPMGYYNWTVSAVMNALAGDASASFFNVVSITNTGNGDEFAVVLKQDNLTETRVYSVKEKDGTTCGQYEAKRTQ